MPEEVKEEKKEEPKPKVEGAMLHSFPKDQKQVSGEVVNDDDIPSEEAIMLADIKTVSNKRRQIGFFRNITIFVLLVAVVIFLFPRFFSNVQNNNELEIINNVKKDKINFDIKYTLEIPNKDDLEKFRTQNFKSESDIALFVIEKDKKVLKFNELSPLVNIRFINGVSAVTSGEYFYGIYTKENKSYPFFILSVTDRDQSEVVLQNIERTMYNDLGVLLQIENDTENETRKFENFNSIINPVRELKNKQQKTILVYGYANDEFVVFTGSQETFNAIKQRILNGY